MATNKLRNYAYIGGAICLAFAGLYRLFSTLWLLIGMCVALAGVFVLCVIWTVLIFANHAQRSKRK